MGEPQELVAGHRALAKLAAQCGGDRLGVLLLDAAHHHAQVDRLHHDADAAGSEHLVDRPGYLLGEPLLHLETAREDLDEARQLREPDDPPVRDVGDVDLPEPFMTPEG